MTEEEQDFSKLSLEERCQHKNWKARVSAYDELTKTFQRIDDDKEWGKYGGWVRKFPTDSNAAAQEKALEVTLLYLANAGLPQAGRIVAEIMSGVVAKCITASKAKSKELAMDIALMCVEVEKFEAVQEELMKGMEHKNPKVLAGCINIFTEVLRSFGPKVINLKTILKKIPILIEDRDKTVRDETKKLMVELYRWLGPAFKPQLSAVKPLVVQEVEAEVEKITEKPHQSRYLRSQQAREERVAGEAGEEAEEEEASEEASPDIDPFDLLDPVDILSKLPKDFYEKCEAKKWQERKEAMEALDALVVANPKLETGDYSDLVRMLKKIISKDTNVVVVALAGKSLCGLANGLKKKFSPYASSCISTILEKFKEKKASVVTAMRDAIDACFVATTLESIQEDTIQALQNKNPAVKLETNTFLARAFAKTPFKTMSDKKLMKPYFTAILANLNEPDANVREAAAEAFGVAMKHLGEKALAPLIADMEAIKLQKVKEYMEKAVITAPKEKGVKPVKAPSSADMKVKANVVRVPGKTDIRKPGGAVVKKPTASANSYPEEEFVEKPPAVSKPVVAAKSAPKVGGTVSRQTIATTTTKKSVSAAKVVEEPIGSNLPVNNLKAQRISDEMRLRILRWNFTTPREEFIDLLKELMIAAGIGPTLMGNMFHSNFKLHLKAIDTLQDEFNMNPDGTKCNLDLILKWATLRFFDTNPSVLIRILDYMINVFQVLSAEDYNMADVEAGAFIPYLVVKLGESKENVRVNVHEILKRVSTIYSSQKVFTYLIEGLRSKNARQRTDCLDEMSSMIGVYAMPVMGNTPQLALKEIAKQISDRDTNVRNAALNAVVQAYYLVGDKVFKMIGQLADKDQSLLDERIKRAGKSCPKPAQSSATLTKPSASVHGTSRINSSGTVHPSEGSPSSPPQAAIVSPIRQYQSQSASSGNILQPQNLNTTLGSSNDDFNNRVLQATFSEQCAVSRTVITKMPVNSRKPYETPMIPTQANQSIDLVVVQLGDPVLRTAIESCVKLEKMLTDSLTSPIMCGRVDTMLAMISNQYLRQQPTLQNRDEEHLNELNKYFSSSVQLLTALFKHELLPKKASRDGLKDIIYHLLMLIIDDNLEQLTDSVTIIRLVNVMVVRIIENTEPNAISCALIRLLNDALNENGGENYRLLELVMKCQWKLLKQHNVWVQNEDYHWDTRAILLEYHYFMKNHPFSSFCNRDGTPLKTIKTIVHALVMQAGVETIQSIMNDIPELKNSEGGVYISKIIQRELLKKTSIAGVTSSASTL
ncbi:protein mini spindles isoform X2 [Folsomia candida]|uniref:protein mini spindles isoform X2 n=1 Tax=Folsomia candida TaxID=158441 RepID=UPI000B8F911E|nr:protein mini spindles isoform X2 [Folsomia candida]